MWQIELDVNLAENILKFFKSLNTSRTPEWSIPMATFLAPVASTCLTMYVMWKIYSNRIEKEHQHWQGQYTLKERNKAFLKIQQYLFNCYKICRNFSYIQPLTLEDKEGVSTYKSYFNSLRKQMVKASDYYEETSILFTKEEQNAILKTIRFFNDGHEIILNQLAGRSQYTYSEFFSNLQISYQETKSILSKNLHIIE